MKELDNFTVERLEAWINTPEKYDHRYSPRINCDELRSLAAIALAAKRAEPVINIKFKDGWPIPESGGVINSGNKLADGYHDFYTTPYLNSPEIPDGWKLTPITPTSEMIAAALDCDDVAYDLEDDSIFCVRHDEIYTAMLDAAPEKPL